MVTKQNKKRVAEAETAAAKPSKHYKIPPGGGMLNETNFFYRGSHVKQTRGRCLKLLYLKYCNEILHYFISRFQVPLGVLMKDENRSGDMMDVMDHYHQYVPSREDGTPIPVIFFGDGLSCERAVSAKRGRLNTPTAWTRLEGLEPAVQEWHCRMHLMEVDGLLFHILWNIFYIQYTCGI